jgi:tripartite-type tricarboxylate transporter receptor subunit TctC
MQGNMFRMVIAVSLLTFILCSAGWGQTYPARPVRIVVGFGPSGPDTTARIIAAELTKQTGQSFFVENRPGASGTIGADAVAKAPPDGYTLLVASSTFALTPSVTKNLPFDVLRDFAPITQLGRSDAFILLASPSLTVRNVKEFIELARKPGSKMAYGSSGLGSTSHLAGAVFNALAKTNMVHVPYTSAGAATTALMSGEIQIMFTTLGSGIPLVKAGKIRGLAYDHEKRSPFMPDVPTMEEAGGPPTGIPAGGQFLFAPAKTPPATLAAIEAAVRKAVASPEVRERFTNTGLEPVGMPMAQFKPFFADAVKRYSEAARAAGVQPE